MQSDKKRFVNKPRRPLPEMVTAKGLVQCRFSMFVVLNNGVFSRYPGEKRCWCYRGDKFSNEPDRMLSNLVQTFLKHHKSWKLCELYDNTRAKNNPERMVLKFHNGVIEINRLYLNYEFMLGRSIIPEWLKIPSIE